MSAFHMSDDGVTFSRHSAHDDDAYVVSLSLTS
jgi:hypothetical protein